MTACTACYTPSYSPLAGSCIQITTCNSLAATYDDGLTPCVPCMAHCQVCYDGSSCVTCMPTFKYLKSKCTCNQGLNMFLDNSIPGGGQCITCQSALDSGVSYLANCKICKTSFANYPSIGIECLQCLDGFY